MLPCWHRARLIAWQQAAPHEAAQQAPAYALLHLGDGVRIEPVAARKMTLPAGSGSNTPSNKDFRKIKVTSSKDVHLHYPAGYDVR